MKNDSPNKIVSEKLGSAIKNARLDAGMSQTDLSKAAKYNTSVHLSRIESGAVLSGNETLRRLADALGLDESYFIKIRDSLKASIKESEQTILPGDVQPPWNLTPGGGPLDEIYALPSNQFDMLLSLKALINAKVAEYAKLEDAIGIRLPNFDSLRTRCKSYLSKTTDPRLWAQAARAEFGIGMSGTLRDLVQILERRGVRIIFTDILGVETAKSFYDRTRFMPVIALNKSHTAERVLNYLAREIAYLCFWFANDCKTLSSRDEHKDFAQAFSAELLVPEMVLTRYMYQLNMVSEDWTFKMICEVKIHFGVSAQLFTKRLRELGKISDEQFKRIYDEIQKNYGHSEPTPHIPPEALQQESWLNLLRARAH